MQMGGGVRTQENVQRVLRFGVDDDGMPLPPGRRPPANLANRALAYYSGLLARSRKYVRSRGLRFRDADMDRIVVRPRRDGTRTRHSVRWIHYHVLEHFAGHYGQILLLRHLYKDQKSPA